MNCGSIATIAYPGYKLPVARLRAGLSHMRSVILQYPGYTLRITHVHIRERSLVGVLLLLLVYQLTSIGIHDGNQTLRQILLNTCKLTIVILCQPLETKDGYNADTVAPTEDA